VAQDLNLELLRLEKIFFFSSNVHPQGKIIIHNLDELDFSSFLVIKYGGCGQRYLN
jgi:hypothetical protein